MQKCATVIALSLCLLGSVKAQSGPAWYNTGGTWSNRKSITIDHTKVAGSLASFPVLISITDAALQTKAKTDGSDILFTSADGLTKLNHELEQYNSATGQLIAWVNVPAVSSTTDTVLYMYYGNPAAAAQQNRTATWDSSYSAVYHLGAPTSLSAVDSTTNANDGTNSGTTATTGMIGGAGSFAGSHAISTGSSAMSFSHTTPFTFEAWINPSNLTGRQGIWQRLKDGVHYLVLELNGAKARLMIGDGSEFLLNSTADIPAGTWTHIAGVRAQGTLTVYVNGVASGTMTETTSGDFFTGYGTPWLGYHQYGVNFSGLLDEVRVSATNRSAAWIATEYVNQSAPGAFSGLGAEEAPPTITVTSSPSGRTLTVDGSPCTAPCTYQWTPGGPHTIAAATQAGATGTQYVFTTWSDSGAASHAITSPSIATTYTANFTTQYYLTTAVSPSAGGAIAPLSGWHDANSSVQVSAAASSGYQFSGFTGALAGTTSPQPVTMSAPVNVTANFTLTGSAPWYSTGGTWTSRKQIAIDHTKVAGPLANFPVLISITDANLQAKARADGADILFTSDDRVTKLNHEIEQYNSATGQLIAWVNVPAVSSTTDTVLYMYYGNPAAAAQQNRTATWDSAYSAVLHLGSSTSLSAIDSTTNANDGTNSGTTATAGMIGGAGSFAGSHAISTGSGAMSFSHTTPFTFEAWINPSNLTGRQGIWQRLKDGIHYLVLELNGAKARLMIGDGSEFLLNSTADIPAGTWTHIAGVRAQGTLTVYVNGVASGTMTETTSGDFFTGYGTPWLGYHQYGVNFSGLLDEVRVSATNRSAAWIATEYVNQSAPGTFSGLGAEEASGATGPAITVTSSPGGRTLTVDGTPCTAPCTYQWTPGVSHTIAAATQAGATGTQYVFTTWSDSGASSHAITSPSTATTYTANFTTQYYLTTAASPSAGGAIAPLSGWHDANSSVQVSAAANSGYQFSGFTGALAGTTSPQPVTMSAPVNVTANFTLTGSAPWYSTGGVWTSRKQIGIDHTKVAGSVANFPVLISITDANLQAKARADGADILFTSADGVTKLNHELEQYISATGKLTAWVNIPSLSSAADTPIYMYYGNASSTAQQNSAGTWDTSYSAVFHLGDGTTFSTADATGNANSGVNSGTTAAAGVVSGAGSFAGSHSMTSGSAGMSFGHTTPFTFEAWVNPSNLTGRQGIWQRLKDGLHYTVLELNGAHPRLLIGDGSELILDSPATIPAGTWTHIAGVRAQGTLTLYVNGVASGTMNETTSGDFFTGYGIPSLGYHPFGVNFSGLIDEARVSATNRSAAWIATEYANQSAPGAFYSIAAEETSGAATTTITVTSAPPNLSLTVDGTACPTPCSKQWIPGSSHTIAAATQAGAAGTQYVFQSWSDGGAPSHFVTAPGAAATFTANFTTQYFLTTAVSPAAGGTISPAAGWRDAGSNVPVSAAANSGYQFTGFTGSLTGTTTPQNAIISGPMTVTANMISATAPELSPFDGATDRPVAMSLTWSTVAGATSYDVYFGSGTPMLATTTTQTTYSVSGLNRSSSYSWYVVPKNAAGTGVTPPPATFTTVPPAPAAAPTPLSPDPGSPDQAVKPTLTWQPVTGAQSYDVYLGVGTPVFVTNVTEARYTPNSALNTATGYAWRVVAKNSGGAGPSSELRSFTTGSRPGQVTLSSPPDKSTDRSRTITLLWTKLPDPGISYEVYYGPDAANLALRGTVATGSLTPAPPLDPGLKYYWYVKAVSSAGDGESSNVWSFTTVPSAPTAPVPLSPANLASGQPLTPSLSWSGGEGATSFDVYLGQTDTPPFADRVTGQSYQAGVAGSTKYYWKVVANNSGGSTSSVVSSFTTAMGAPTLTTPGNAATNVSSRPTFTWSAVAGADTYEVRLGIGTGTPQFEANVTTPSFTPTTALAAQTNYSWLVLAQSNAGDVATSATWTFTTAAAGFIPSASKYSREYVRLGGRLIAIEDPPLTIRTLTGVSTLTGATTVPSGGSLTLTATLTGAAPPAGAIVPVTSSNTSLIPNPGNITIGPGQTTGTITVAAGTVTQSTDVTLTATFADTATASVTVLPAVPLPTVTSVLIGPASTFTSGTNGSVTVTLSGPAPTGGAQVALSVSPSASAGLFPVGTIPIPAGSTQGVLSNIPAGVVVSPTILTVNAAYGGSSLTSAAFTITPIITLSSVTLIPSTVVSGAYAIVSVRLSGPAPAAGLQVDVSSSNTTVFPIPVNTRFQFTEGQSVIENQYIAGSVSGPVNVTITASYNGVTRTATLTVTAPLPTIYSVYVSPDNPIPTTTAYVNVALTAPAPPGGATVTLATSNSSAFPVPLSLVVPEYQLVGVSTGITVQAVSGGAQLTVTASYNNTSKTAPVNVPGIYLVPGTSLLLPGQSTQIQMFPPQNVTWSASGPPGGGLSTTGPSLTTVYTAPLVTGLLPVTISGTTTNSSVATTQLVFVPPTPSASPSDGRTLSIAHPITFAVSGGDIKYPNAPWQRLDEYLGLVVWRNQSFCWLEYQPATRTASILNNLAAPIDSGAIGTTKVLESSTCSVDAGTITAFRNGIVLNMGLDVLFKPSFLGGMSVGPLLRGVYESTAPWGGGSIVLVQ